MSAQEQKPAVTTEAGVVEPTPAPAEVVTADKPAEAVEPKPEEPAKEEPKAETETALPAVEEKKEEKAEEPIYSGALGYKAPGLRNQFRFSKKYFWLGEEPVSVQSLSNYLRGEKADVAHPTAAWSSQTGKGLLYFVKHADEKATPAGVLNLSEATDLSKDGTVAFFFKLHGHKHTFETATLKERNGWFVALEKAIEEAKAAKEGIVSSESYKEELAKLRKPAPLAPTAAKEESAPKKSVDATTATATKPAEAEAAPAEGAATAERAGSSSSSSSDEEKKKKKANKSKSRSVSRGKRSSIFGGLLGKKDKAEEKVEEKKEEKKEEAEAKKEEKKADETPAEGTTVVGPTAPVIPPVEETTKPTEESKIDEAVQAAATEEKKADETKPEEKKGEEKPKPTKRTSIFGSFVEKLKSPTTEKKEHEVAPAVPAKETETAAAPKVEETPAAAAPAPIDTTTAATEAPKTEEAKETKPATTPAKEKQHFSFGKFLGGAKEKVRSPSGEKAPELPKTEEPAKAEETATPAKTEETAAVPAPVEPAAVDGAKEEKVEENKEAKETTSPTTKKRGSIFGNFGTAKKEGDSEKPQGLKGLFRQASKAGKGKKEEKAPATPAKVDETTEPKEEKAAEAPKVEEEKKEETPAAPAAAEPAAIGDVVPEAVQVGQAPKSTPQVSASA